VTPRLILASQSPRRRALLAALGVPFEVAPSGAEEIDHGAAPIDIVIRNARAKRDDLRGRTEGPAVIIAADTLVFLDKEVLSKPHDRAEAIEMLRKLSGNTHQVITGLSIINTQSGQAVEGSETTSVSFRPLNTPEIERFVDIVNPLDRAGAYTVDGPGSLLVARYDGCYYNVLGLPIVKLDMLLRQAGVDLFTLMHPDGAVFL
jgi:septum formation protein